MTNYKLRDGISWFMSIVVFITIWVVMILFVEWDGSKPGGWGWYVAGPVALVASIVAMWMTRLISRILLVDMAKEAENANIERERRKQIIEQNAKARREIANYKPT